jgi:hypothetical protein
MMVRGRYRPLSKPPEGMPRAAKAANALRSRTCARLYLCDTLFERLAPPFEPGAVARRPRIHKEPAVGSPRPLARPRPLAAADQVHIGNGMMRGAKRTRHDQCLAGAREQNVPVRGACRG